jgi:hypothetical protein
VIIRGRAYSLTQCHVFWGGGRSRGGEVKGVAAPEGRGKLHEGTALMTGHGEAISRALLGNRWVVSDRGLHTVLTASTPLTSLPLLLWCGLTDWAAHCQHMTSTVSSSVSCVLLSPH